MKKGNKRFKKFVADDYEARKYEKKAQKEKSRSERKRSNEIIRDLKNYELEFRIADLESKFSKDLSETTFNELKELKKQQKIN